MTKADQIAATVSFIQRNDSIFGLMMTDLKALVQAYQEQREEIERLKALYDDCCRCNGDLMKTAVSKGIEIDGLKAENERLKRENDQIREVIAQWTDAIYTTSQSMDRIYRIVHPLD